MMKTLITAAPGLAFLILAGCAQAYNFQSLTALGNGVSGKNWGTPYSIDADLANPASLPAGTPMVRDFSADVSGSNLQLAATFYDKVSTNYLGYARLYADGTGWSPIGPSFAVVASVTGNDLGYASIAAGPGGFFLATFTQDNINPLNRNLLSVANTGSSWIPATASKSPVSFNYTKTEDMGDGRHISTSFDSLGRGYLNFQDGTNTDYDVWQLATGISSAVTVLGGGAYTAFPRTSAVYDGIKYYCPIWDMGFFLSPGVPEGIESACQDTSVATAPTLAELSNPGFFGAGVASATDGVGTIVSVFLQGTTSAMDTTASPHVYANFIQGGAVALPGLPLQIDAAMPSGYLALSKIASGLGYAAPGIAYLGSGQFLAAWIGYCPTCTVLSTQVFYSIFNEATATWTDASAVQGTYDSYTVTPHSQSISVFGNGAGNAGIALSHIYVNPSPPSPPLESANMRKLLVNRFQINDGWLTSPGLLGNGCTVSIAKRSSCTHPPVGIIFPSGDTVVLFQDQDNIGNYHLSAVEFR